MDLKELLKQKQQKQQFNNVKQQAKSPMMANKPQKRATGRGR